MARLFRKADDVPNRSLWQRIKDVALADVTAVARRGAKEGSLEAVEELLLDADFGVPTTLQLVESLDRAAQRGAIRTHDEFLHELSTGIRNALLSGNADRELHFAATKPTVILVIGVNGAGKTTFIGKLAGRFRRAGKSVILAAGDTFRAGAIDQLRVWAERVGADFVGGKPGGDQPRWRTMRLTPA